MKMPSLMIVGSLVVGSGAALAQSGGTADVARAPGSTVPDFRKTVEEWEAVPATGGAGSSGSSKVQVVNLIGDPSKPGLYMQLLKVAPHVTIQAHHHAGDRTASVLKGAMMFGYGPKFDASKLKVMPAGSVYTEPSGSPHFAATGDQPAVAEITGFGPTDTVYENPADDPASKQGGK